MSVDDAVDAAAKELRMKKARERFEAMIWARIELQRMAKRRPDEEDTLLRVIEQLEELTPDYAIKS
jgi:hypothetical protein